MSYFLRLKDPSTTFYDMTTGISITRNQVAKLKKVSGRMQQAINSGQLVQLTETEGLAEWKKQNPEAKAEAKETPKAETPVAKEEPEQEPEQEETVGPEDTTPPPPSRKTKR